MAELAHQTTNDGIAHGLAVAVVEAVQALAADLTPEHVQQAAEARAVAEGHPDPAEAARTALWTCLQALEAIQATAKNARAAARRAGGSRGT